MQDTYLKRADWNDVELLFEWINEEGVRANSFHADKIEYDTHVAWFREKLSDENTLMYLYYENQTPIGQIRLDVSADTAIINYSIDRKYRGQGYGRDLLMLTEREICQYQQSITWLKARVRLDNVASQVLFERLSYQKEKKDDYIEYTKKQSKE